MLLIVSGIVVTFAPNYALLMVGRALLGVAIGGFWSMSTAIVMRLLPEDMVPKGLAMLNAGNAIAATISAPLGSFLGAYLGWRGAFFLVVPLGLLALVWQWISLPPLPPRGRQAVRQRVRAAWPPAGRARHGLDPAALHGPVRALHLSCVRSWRPSPALDIPALSLMLLVMGLAGVAGTWCVEPAAAGAVCSASLSSSRSSWRASPSR